MVLLIVWYGEQSAFNPLSVSLGHAVFTPTGMSIFLPPQPTQILYVPQELASISLSFPHKAS